MNENDLNRIWRRCFGLIKTSKPYGKSSLSSPDGSNPCGRFESLVDCDGGCALLEDSGVSGCLPLAVFEGSGEDA